MTDLKDFPMSPALEKAIIAKVKAETKRTDLESLALEAEAQFDELRERNAKAELRTSLAHAIDAEQTAIATRINTDALVRAERFTLAGDHYHHQLHFAAPVDYKSVDKALQQLAVWDRQNPECDINITINSPGGDAIAGLHLFDQLVAYSLRGVDGKGTGGGHHKVTVTVRGHAASMAGILLQAADERVIGPTSWLMIHEISAGTGGKIGEIKDDYEWFKVMCEQIAEVFVVRSGGKISAKDFAAKWTDRNWWINAKDSLKFGFVDRIG